MSLPLTAEARGRFLAAGRRLALVALWISVAANTVEYAARVRGFFGWNDFRLYLAGARVGLSHGWAHMYDPQLQQAAVAQMQPAAPWFALLTPPPIAWLAAPFTLLPYSAAYWVWTGLLAALLLVAAWLARPRQPGLDRFYWPWLLSLCPLGFTIYEGQASGLAAAGLLIAWRLLHERRDGWAGLALVLIVLKPHTAVAVPLCLLAAGRYRAVATFLAGSASLVAASAALLGPAGVEEYVSAISAPQPYRDYWMTLHGLIGGGLVLVAAGAAAGLVAVAVSRLTRDPGRAISAGILVSFLVATYWHPQDFLVIDTAAVLQFALGWGRLTAYAIVGAAALSSPLNPYTGWLPAPPLEWLWIPFVMVWLTALLWSAKGSLRLSSLAQRPPPAGAMITRPGASEA